MKNKKIPKRDLTKLQQAFIEIQMPRTPFALEHFVVNSKFTDQQRYAQCVLELSIAYDNLRMTNLSLEKAKIEMAAIDTTTRLGEIDKEMKQIEVEQTERAVIGAMREFEFLYDMWEKFPKKYTREELNNASQEEYTKMLETQAHHDLNAHGRIGVGNQEGLRQLGKVVYPQLDVARDVEKRFLEEGKSRMLIAVATEKKAESRLPCVENLTIPNGVEFKLFNCWGRKIDEAYNHIIETAITDKVDYVVTVEDDTFPPQDALVKLMDLLRKNPKSAVGAWYPKREKSLEGVPIVIKDGKRQYLEVDNKVHEVYTLPMGCSIFPIEMFMEIPYPWFATTANLSQDSFFSQLAREHGWKLLVDTAVRCKHIDRVTGEVFEIKD